MCYWTGDIAAKTDISQIGDRLQAEFGIELQPVSREIERLLAQLRSAERLTRIRSGF
jgi:hypothetical protein